MFVRRTQTRRSDSGETYHTHRLVRSERVGGKVRQRTLLNLGRHFDIEREHWPLLCVRVGEALSGQAALLADCPPAVEREAQRIAAQLIARAAAPAGDAAARDIQAVDVDSLELARPRGVGAERVGLWALEQVGLPALLREHRPRAARGGAGLHRRAHGVPRLGAGDDALAARSAAWARLDVDFETMGAMQLYRASDALMAHREAMSRTCSMLFERTTVTLYDLTEGEAKGQPLARRGQRRSAATVRC